MGENTQRNVSDPVPLDKMAMRKEVVVDGDLDEVARHMRTAFEKGLEKTKHKRRKGTSA